MSITISFGDVMFCFELGISLYLVAIVVAVGVVPILIKLTSIYIYTVRQKYFLYNKIKEAMNKSASY